MSIKAVYSDLDGTLIHDGPISHEFVELMALLESKSIPMTIVSGRSRAWGHFFLAHYPQIKSCIMEGGGVLIKKGAKDQFFEAQEEYFVSETILEEFDQKVATLLSTFPQVQLSSDSLFRRFDRAIPLEYLREESLKTELLEYLQNHDIKFAMSNVHLNFWPGNADKAKAIRKHMDEYYPDLKMEEVVFFGDSNNDQEVFQEFPHTVGVSNITQNLHLIKHQPKIILEGPNNAGPKGVLNYLKESL